MKLKPIPKNTVVHTPTEAEAKELLAILSENGYKWYGREELIEHPNWHCYETDTCYCMESFIVVFARKQFYISRDYTILTLTEFKRLYCEEEKPQPKFKVGDKVRIIQDDTVNPDYVGIVDEIVAIAQVIRLRNTDSNWFETCLEPYTEPEIKEDAKDTKDETMKTKDDTKELNLCELLKGHEGETFYSPVCGTEIELKEVFKSFLVFYLDKDDDCTIECETRGWQRIGTLDECGTFKSITYPDSACLIFPSRALYEQYPLNPQKAWSVWQEEQKKIVLDVNFRTYDAPDFGEVLHFRIPTDRDKCIKEIKAIIEKYRK